MGDTIEVNNTLDIDKLNRINNKQDIKLDVGRLDKANNVKKEVNIYKSNLF